MKISNIIKCIFSLFLVMTLLSCIGKKSIIAEEKQIEPQPKLLFLNYKIEKLEDKKTISLINQIKTDGKLKETVLSRNNTTIGDLEYLILDKDLNQLERHYIKNPLKKVIEFINDSGNFEKKMLDLDRSEFSLRLQLKSKAEYIVINEITSEGITKLNTTKIE
ncbi:hypothetical protein [Winogradskyella helgolandensis]|nr:hypothetical protein [Winogradskyella helgolandensis]